MSVYLHPRYNLGLLGLWAGPMDLWLGWRHSILLGRPSFRGCSGQTERDWIHRCSWLDPVAPKFLVAECSRVRRNGPFPSQYHTAPLENRKSNWNYCLSPTPPSTPFARHTGYTRTVELCSR